MSLKKNGVMKRCISNVRNVTFHRTAIVLFQAALTYLYGALTSSLAKRPISLSVIVGALSIAIEMVNMLATTTEAGNDIRNQGQNCLYQDLSRGLIVSFIKMPLN